MNIVVLDFSLKTAAADLKSPGTGGCYILYRSVAGVITQISTNNNAYSIVIHIHIRIQTLI